MNFRILRRRVHVSWQIAVLSIALVMGVIFSQYAPLGLFSPIMWLITASILAGIGFWHGQVYSLTFLIMAGGIMGLWRGSLVQVDLAPYDRLIGFQVELQGKVSEDPELDKDGKLLLRVGVEEIDGHALGGNVWVSTSNREVKRGDYVTVRGKLAAGFGSFAASMYRAELAEVQRPVPGDLAGRVRDWFADKIREVLPDPEASLGIGYLLGQRRALPPELDEALQMVGLTHIVVASGYNLTILVRFARRIFVKVSKYLAALTAGSMILSFVLITGFSPSMSRAGLVAGLSLLAWYYGRRFHPIILLSFTAAITLLVNPAFGWNDLGWQLSFLAFGGVMILAPLLQAYFFGDKKPGTLRQIMGETVSAQIVTFPVLVLAFGTFSNVAVVANLLVLPFVPLAMLLVFLCGLFAIALPFAAVLVALPAQWLLGYMVGVADFLAKLPWAQSALGVNGWIVAGAYVLLATAAVYMWQKTKYNFRSSSIVE